MQLSEDKFEEIKEKVKEHLIEHPKRYIHILGVVEMSEYLAKKYDVDPLKAKIAALLHDYSKYDDSDLSPLNADDRAMAEKYPYLAHAYLSAYAARDIFKIEDEDIFNAIYNHVVGRVGMSRLEEIVFISDFTEKNRTYDACIKTREILLNEGIEKAIISSIEKTIDHNLDSGYKAHPNQIRVLNYYKEKILC